MKFENLILIEGDGRALGQKTIIYSSKFFAT